MTLLVVGAIGCLGWLGWWAYTDLNRPVVTSVYAGTSSPAVSLVAPSPVTQVAAAAQPAMAYYAPPKGVRRGTFVPPIGGYVIQLFGPTSFDLEPPLTYQGVTYPHFHTGIDIDAPIGTPVGASAAGVVALIGMADGQARGYGNFVVVQHPQGYLTLYAHLESVTVTLGQSVQLLQLIGYVGSTGLSTGPHLHFEIRRNGYLLDPLPYLLGRRRASW